MANVDFTKVSNVQKPTVQAKEPVKPLNIKTTIRKDSATEKLCKRFFQNDINTVKETIIKQVIVPRVKMLIRDGLVNTIDMLLIGKINTNGLRPGQGNLMFTNYTGMYNFYGNSNNNNQPGQSRFSNLDKGQSQYDKLTHVVFSSSDEAMLYINDLKARIASYGQVSLLEASDILQLSSDYTTDRWGWKSLSEADCYPYPVDCGWCVKLPRVIALQ